MAGISNIIGAYNINPKRISSKLSFEVGQIFSAKIIAAGELNKEIILRLLDGWQFPAKLQKPLDFIPEGLVKLEVEGFEDGKLQIKLVNLDKQQDDLDNNSIEDLLFQSKIDVDKDDYDILKNMVKHNMPITKDNVTKVKTIFDFREKLLNDESEEDKFISKYLSSKNLEPDSNEGTKIKESLKGFFNQLKNISEDEILTMLENNIELSEDNIKSFIKITKEDSTIYKELNSLSKQLNLDINSEITNLDNLVSKIKESPNYNEEINKILNELGQKVHNSTINAKELKLYEALNQLVEENSNFDEFFNNIENPTKLMPKGKNESSDTIITRDIETKPFQNEDISNIKVKVIDIDIDKNNTKENETEIKDLNKSNIKIKDIIVEDEDKNIENKNIENKNIENKGISKNIKDNLIISKKELEVLLKEQLTNKTDEMKNIIKELMDKVDKGKPEIFDKVMQGLKDNINDFKVFNSISNQYYYLNIPINFNKEDYNCKLLIKDDRNTGKKIDSKNVSMVVSVNTSSIGIVDTYIKVKEQNMSVNIKCDESWIKLLSMGKNKLMSELNELGFNTFLSINKREIEADLINCRNFFDDKSLSSINVKV